MVNGIKKSTEREREDTRATGGLAFNLPHPQVNKTKQHSEKVLLEVSEMGMVNIDLYSPIKFKIFTTRLADLSRNLKDCDLHILGRRVYHDSLGPYCGSGTCPPLNSESMIWSYWGEACLGAKVEVRVFWRFHLC